MPQALLTSIRNRARRWAGWWLIALAAGLPLAQAVAAVHALSHAAPALGHPSDDPRALVHLSGCEQCLAAHALVDAAPQPAGFEWHAASSVQAPSTRAGHRAPALEARLAFRSRAPPVIALS